MAYGVIVYDSRVNQGGGELSLPREMVVDTLLKLGATARGGGWYYLTRRQGFVKFALPDGEVRYLTVECPNVTRASFALAAEALTTLAATLPHLELASPASGTTLDLDASSDEQIISFLMTDWRGGLSCAISVLRRELVLSAECWVLGVA